MEIKEYPKEAAAQLISHLSEGVYTTFPKALKELVINAFDASATEVKIIISKDCCSSSEPLGRNANIVSRGF